MTGREFREIHGNDISAMAEKIAESITMRTYDETGSHDVTRPTTAPEREIIKNIAIGALTSYGYRTDQTGSWYSILDMAEFTLMHFIPGVNTYDTIYIPLRNVTETW